MVFSLYELFEYFDLPSIKIVDVGASIAKEQPPYQTLKEIGKAEIVGFEPNLEKYQELINSSMDNELYLPYALGDGTEKEFNICTGFQMSSFLEPNFKVLEYFEGFAKSSEIIKKDKIMTYKLDEIQEIQEIDYLKLDVQGAELVIIENGKNKIKNSLVIHTEVNFIPLYRNQPLFSEIDQQLRQLGFFFHTFCPLMNCPLKPFLPAQGRQGINQILWGDAVYIRDFTELSNLSSESLIKIAIIMNDCYKSFDLAALALKHIDLQEDTDCFEVYIESLNKTKSK